MSKRFPDEGRRNVAPNRGGRSSPTTGAENFAWTINILESGFDERHFVTHPIVVAIEFADDFRNLIRTIEIKRYRIVFGRRLGLIQRLLCPDATGRSLSDGLQFLEILDSLQQFERRQSIILMIGQRVSYRTLIAVIGR